MNRAVVMSLQGKRAVVLAPGGKFLTVPNRNRLQVGDEIDLEEEEVRPVIRRGARRRIWAAGSAASAAAVLLLAGSFWLRTPSVVAYVSMDVNPSIELGIDGKERVRELHALNPDAEPIVAELKFKGRDVGEVTEDIADELAERHLLNGGDSEVVLASVAVKTVGDEWEAEVTTKMKQAIEKAGAIAEPNDTTDEPNDTTGQEASADEGTASGEGTQKDSVPEVTTLSLPKEVREEAKKNGVSSGKMAFWLKAESQGHELSFEELKRSSLKKLAESWGGVGQIFSDDKSSSPNGQSDWQKLLKDAQDKEKGNEQKAQQKNQPKDQPKDQKKDQKKNQKKDQRNDKNQQKSQPDASNSPAKATATAASSGKGAYGKDDNGGQAKDQKNGNGWGDSNNWGKNKDRNDRGGDQGGKSGDEPVNDNGRGKQGTYDKTNDDSKEGKNGDNQSRSQSERDDHDARDSQTWRQ